MPDPADFDSESEFMEACIPDVLADGTAQNQDQAVAVCVSMWNEQEGAMSAERLWRHGIEIRVEQAEGPRIRGHAALFDAPTMLFPGYEEVVRPGAFTASLERGDDVVALWDHKSSRVPLGRRSASTLRVWEDDDGLSFEIDPPDSASDIVESIQRRDVTGASFGFRPVEAPEHIDRDRQVVVRELRQVDLIDVSPVVFPAYSQTEGTVHARGRRLALAFERRLGQIAQDSRTRGGHRRRDLDRIRLGI